MLKQACFAQTPFLSPCLTLGLLPRCHLPPLWQMHVLSLKASTICMFLPRTSGNSMGPPREKITEKYLQGFAHFQITSGLFQVFIKRQVINLTKTLVSSHVLQSQNWSRFSWITWEMTKQGHPVGVSWISAASVGPFWSFLPLIRNFLQQILLCPCFPPLWCLDKKWAEDNICLFKKKKMNLESSTEQSLRKLLMVPRPRKEFQKMTVGRSDNPQNAKSGEYYLVLEQGAPLYNWFF